MILKTKAFSLFPLPRFTEKRGTVSARNITLLIENCVNYYCGLLFNKSKYLKTSYKWRQMSWKM